MNSESKQFCPVVNIATVSNNSRISDRFSAWTVTESLYSDRWIVSHNDCQRIISITSNIDPAKSLE